jgi:hypothetical protein
VLDSVVEVEVVAMLLETVMMQRRNHRKLSDSGADGLPYLGLRVAGAEPLFGL